MDLIQVSIDNQNWIIYRSIFPHLKTNMFILMKDSEAVVIDPHVSEEAFRLLKDNGIRKVEVLLTHEHFDHTSGVNWFIERFESTLIAHSKCAESVAIARNNRPILLAFTLAQIGKPMDKNILNSMMSNPYECKTDIMFNAIMERNILGLNFRFIPTPGHTPGSACIEIGTSVVFTGDTLIMGEPIITRFPGGNKKELKEISFPYLEALNREILICPGHGNVFKYDKIDLSEVFNNSV